LKDKPLISIITVTYNAGATLAQCVQSVLSQSDAHVEYILIDGGSTDDSLKQIEPYRSQITHIVSEPDKGIYDAMNKGIRLASGDIVGILNADDFYPHDKVLKEVTEVFTRTSCDIFCGSVAIFKGGDFKKVWRLYDATRFRLWHLRMGMQPPHPGAFIQKKCYDLNGLYDTEMRISGDFDMFVRLLMVAKFHAVYSKSICVHMRDGGVSSKDLKAKILMNKEDLRALRKYGIRSTLWLIWLKYPFKLFQLWLTK
jgi:glycosyltransferase involved in cell wall biosynthesis